MSRDINAIIDDFCTWYSSDERHEEIAYHARNAAAWPACGAAVLAMDLMAQSGLADEKLSEALEAFEESL